MRNTGAGAGCEMVCAGGVGIGSGPFEPLRRICERRLANVRRMLPESDSEAPGVELRTGTLMVWERLMGCVSKGSRNPNSVSLLFSVTREKYQILDRFYVEGE